MCECMRVSVYVRVHEGEGVCVCGYRVRVSVYVRVHEGEGVCVCASA
jgi:hypothetical protein